MKVFLVSPLHQRQWAYRGACPAHYLERREDEHELLHTGRRELREVHDLDDVDAVLSEEQAVNGQESVPYLGLYLLVGYGLGARRPHATTGEPAGCLLGWAWHATLVSQEDPGVAEVLRPA